MMTELKSSDRVISEIVKKFQSIRDTKKGQPRYTAEARMLALSAIDQGHSISEIAIAAAVTCKSIRNWQKNVGNVSPPINLKLVKSKKNIEVTPEQLPRKNAVEKIMIARVHFRSGAVLEIEVEALTPSLIAALNGVF